MRRMLESLKLLFDTQCEIAMDGNFSRCAPRMARRDGALHTTALMNIIIRTPSSPTLFLL